MKIYLATDHSGLELKNYLKAHLEEKNFDIEDCGAYEYDADDDYPDLIKKAAAAVSEDPENTMGIVIGGSAQGEAIVANKYSNVRCAVFYSKAVPVGSADITGRTSDDPFEIIKLTREHNNSNMLSLSARFLTQEDALTAAEVFLNTPFPKEQRHERRINKISQIENE
jgi:ribose 5-phosphate isomerase B